jgi:hypothetical protein
MNSFPLQLSVKTIALATEFAMMGRAFVTQDGPGLTALRVRAFDWF